MNKLISKAETKPPTNGHSMDASSHPMPEFTRCVRIKLSAIVGVERMRGIPYQASAAKRIVEMLLIVGTLPFLSVFTDVASAHGIVAVSLCRETKMFWTLAPEASAISRGRGGRHGGHLSSVVLSSLLTA